MIFLQRLSPEGPRYPDLSPSQTHIIFSLTGESLCCVQTYMQHTCQACILRGWSCIHTYMPGLYSERLQLVTSQHLSQGRHCTRQSMISVPQLFLLETPDIAGRRQARLPFPPAVCIRSAFTSVDVCHVLQYNQAKVPRHLLHGAGLSTVNLPGPLEAAEADSHRAHSSQEAAGSLPYARTFLAMLQI